MQALDKQDIKLLRALEADGRLTNHDLAEAIGLSASQCSRRRNRLERDAVITGYRAVVDGKYLDRAIIVLVNVRLSTHSRDNASRFRELVAVLDPITAAYALAGESDYQLRIEVASLEQLADFLSQQLLAHETVQQIRSSVVLEVLK